MVNRPMVNRVLADLGDVPSTGQNIYKGVQVADNNNLRTPSMQYIEDIWTGLPATYMTGFHKMT